MKNVIALGITLLATTIAVIAVGALFYYEDTKEERNNQRLQEACLNGGGYLVLNKIHKGTTRTEADVWGVKEFGGFYCDR